MGVIDELEWRELLVDATEGVAQALNSEPTKGYIGFDPTAASLHVGTLIPIMGLVHLQRAGHTPVALVGGGTGLIGDPSGKSAERQLLDRTKVEENAAGIRDQLAHFLDFDVATNPAVMVNNLDWLDSIGLLDFLRDTGKHFSVNAMLRKESVRRRIGDDESGISFTEFSYQLLQAYDFLELNRRMGCTLQMGGTDQWGNITAGIDLIRRVTQNRAFGAVLPLVTTSSGAKFGKTESGTIWLDAELTSPFRFFQFWLNTDDRDVIRYLKWFTLLGPGDIEELASSVETRPQDREAQRRLATEVTRALHGEDGLVRARQASEALFGGSLDGLSAGDIEDIFSDVPSSAVTKSVLEARETDVISLAAEAGVTASKGEARRLVQGGGLYLNNVRVDDGTAKVAPEDALHGRFLVLRAGKKRYHVVEVA